MGLLARARGKESRRQKSGLNGDCSSERQIPIRNRKEKVKRPRLPQYSSLPYKLQPKILRITLVSPHSF